MSTLSYVAKTLSYTLRAGCFVHLIHAHVYEFTETRGESMLPTLSASNDYVHAIKKYKYGRGLEIGDCIVAVKPTDPDQRVCKRITGMPGDIIQIDPSMGSVLTGTGGDDSFDSYIKVPKGHVWVTGDNLSHSLDSRTYNSLPMGLIKGKIVAAQDFNKGWTEGFRFIDNTYK